MENYIKIGPENEAYNFLNAIYEEIEEAERAERAMAERPRAEIDWSKSWTLRPFGNRF